MKNISRQLGSLIALAGLLLSAPALIKVATLQAVKAQPAKAPAAKCVDATATSVLNLAGDISQSTNYRIQGDGLGPYYNGFDSVSSVIQGANCTTGVWGDWVVNTLDSPTRRFLIDLRQPVPNSGTQPIFTYEYVPARVIVECGGYANNGGFPVIGLNQTVSCPAFVRFTYAGISYRLAMTSNGNPTYPETNNVQVTCTAMNASNQCAAWTVFPITQTGGAVQSIARLERYGNGGKLRDLNLGDFYTTFLFNVTNP